MLKIVPRKKISSSDMLGEPVGPTPFTVRLVRAPNGERIPILLNRSTGIPDFDASLWVLSSLRSKNVASETIAQALRSVIVLYLFLHSARIDLAKRFSSGQFLNPSELELLSVTCRKTVQDSVRALSCVVGSGDTTTRKIASLEKFRMRKRDTLADIGVSAGTTAIRMGYIREFLRWRANRAIACAKHEKKAEMIAFRDLIDEELQNKTPAVTHRASIRRRSGISRESQNHLLDMTMPSNPLNPWIGTHVRCRNQFIINAILGLGLRRGECLGLRVGDISAQMQEVSILRRPDDATDPRLHEPNTKTRDRVLPISYQLHVLFKEYLMIRNQKVHGQHDFLIVTNAGTPISKSEINQIFNVLSKKLLQNISPHVLRHTCFENLAEDLFNAGKNDIEVQKILTRLGGWSESSNSPARYTQRFANEKAAKASLTMQMKLYGTPIPKTQDE